MSRIINISRFRIAVNGEANVIDLGCRLRRSLLEDIPGLAVTAVRIDGVAHEFQPVPGARETALDIIMNIKKLRVRSAADSVRCTLDCARAIVTAADLELDNGEVVDAGLHIAHLSPGARLRLEVMLEKDTGRGVSSRAPNGFIPVDASFSPVKRVGVSTCADFLEITVETDGSVTPESALADAMRSLGESHSYEVLTVPERVTPHVEIGPEFSRDPFCGMEPPSGLELAKRSYERFLSEGLARLMDSLFPLVSRRLDPYDDMASRRRHTTRERRIDLLGFRLNYPDVTPEQCIDQGISYQADLLLNVRVMRNDKDLVFSADHPQALSGEEINLGPIPLMTDSGLFVINGARRAAIMVMQEDGRVLGAGELLEMQLSALISQMKPVLEDRMNLRGWLSADILHVLPFSATIQDLMTSSNWSQYLDETNPLASLTHKTRISALGLVGEEADEQLRLLHNSHFGRYCYLQTPEGPNIGLILSTCVYTRLDADGNVLTPYYRVEDGKVGDVVYLTAEQEAGIKIADFSAIDSDGRLTGEDVLVRLGPDIIRVSSDEVDMVAVSPVQSLSVSAGLIPFLGHDDPNRALMAANMQRQALPLIRSEQPLVKSGLERLAARDCGEMVTAKRAGRVVEATAERVIVRTPSGDDVYPLSVYRRTNQDSCFHHIAVVTAGESVEEGQLLAEAPGTRGGEIALGRNVLVAYMPFKGLNFEDAICASDELLSEDTFTSVRLCKLHADTAGADVWVAPVGARLNPGDVLVQESSGRRRDLLRVPPYNPVVVVDVRRSGEAVVITLAELSRIQPGDKFSARAGNKGVIARVLPRSQMPYMEDGTPIQMVLNTVGVVSRLNPGQILETHYGMLARALGVQFTIPPFMSPPHDLLRVKLAEAGLSETGMVTLYDGMTGRKFESPVTVGWQYIYKLAHTVDDKIRAVSTTFPSAITHQPVYGGQRLGFREMWALEAYNASSTLQEFLTIKSDDLRGRERAALALLSGEDVEPAGEGESLRLLANYLRGLGIDVEEVR